MNHLRTVRGASLHRVAVIFQCLLAALVVLVAGGAAEARSSGKAKVGGMSVSWSSVDAKLAASAGVMRPMTLLLFTFDTGPVGTAVSDADWAREAARHGVDTATIKMIIGPSAYVTAAGRVASCTAIAVDKGLCGKVRVLRLEEKVEIARKILAAGKGCEWAGFDPSVHQAMAQRAGAGNATLWVAARCS